jgi:hypothetical protein
MSVGLNVDARAHTNAGKGGVPHVPLHAVECAGSSRLDIGSDLCLLSVCIYIIVCLSWHGAECAGSSRHIGFGFRV